MYFPQQGPTQPKAMSLPKTAPTAKEQGFQHMSLLETFLISTTM